MLEESKKIASLVIIDSKKYETRLKENYDAEDMGIKLLDSIISKWIDNNREICVEKTHKEYKDLVKYATSAEIWMCKQYDMLEEYAKDLEIKEEECANVIFY